MEVAKQEETNNKTKNGVDRGMGGPSGMGQGKTAMDKTLDPVIRTQRSVSVPLSC